MIEDLFSAANVTFAFGVLVAIATGVKAIVVGLHDAWLRLRTILSPPAPSRLVLVPTPDEILRYSVKTSSAAELSELTAHNHEEKKRQKMLYAVRLKQIERGNERLSSMALAFISAFATVAYSFARLMILD